MLRCDIMVDGSWGNVVRSTGTLFDVNPPNPRRKFRKGDRSRRSWTVREEEIFAACLLALVSRGWKSDNGFRAEYLGKIEDAIRQEFPNTDIKGTPHVNSKLTAWKKSYQSLRNILSRSGVGFNSDNEYRIECDDDQWEAIVMADKEAKFMRHKSWPLWETWKVIFGKDRACGGGAEQISDAAEAFRRGQPGTYSEVNENDYHPSLDDIEADKAIPSSQPFGNHDMSSGNSGKQTSVNTSNASKKRKLDGSDAALMEFLANLHTDTNSRLEMILARIGYEFDLGQARQDVFAKLCDVDGLTLNQRYELCNILGDKPQRMEIFMGMQESARLGYLLKLIEDKQSGI
ncbi:uncharacterized protein LOC121761568 isoform X1 [Salvia splendens]|uniref:uncharacterized protein LOC121761568 isoform X1 n=2 Tax=Salvia splendens TaxID=180675 RepID=UPI001C257887|nr:uncharacterized protein LOC121761568 isoform X1 [Salvia splendens]